MASLGSLANEVSVIYGLKPNPKLLNDGDGAMKPEQVITSMDQLYALRSSALTGAATAGLGLGLTHASLTDRLGQGDHRADLVAGNGSDHRLFWRAHRPVQR